MKIKLITTILFLAALITACSSTPPPASTPSATATPQTAVTVSSTPTVEMTPTPFQAEATSTPPAVATTQPIDQPITLTAPQLNPLALGERISLTNTGDVTFQLRILNAYIGQSAARLILRARPAEELKLVVIIPEIKYVSGPAGQRQALINEDSFRIISKGHVLENDFMGYTPPSNHINEIRLLPGETSQAYLVFAVYKDDDHPVLRVTNQGKSYFFDLTKPVPPAAPVQITPLQFSAAGPGSAAQPVALGKSVLYHWQGATLLLTVDRMERGLDATKRIWNIGSINQAAGAGQEYIMPYLHVQVVSSTTDLTVIDRALFKIFSSGAPLENVSPLSCPMSCLSTLALYQGGEAQGWLPLAVSISDPQPVLGFNEELFFSLKESSPAQNAGSAEYIPPTFPANAITAATMKQVGTTAELQQHSTVYSLAFSPDNRLLASGSDDHKIHIWDTASGVELKTLEKHPMGVKYISFSADGKWMVSVSFDENIIVWNTADWQIVQQLKQGGQGIFGEFLPDNTLITANQAGTITQWDVSGGKALKKYQTQKNITAACSNSGLYSFDMTPDGKVFAAALACGYGVAWEPANGTRLVTDYNHAVDSGQFPYTAAISLSHIGALAAYGGSYYESGGYFVDIADAGRQLILGGLGTATVNIPAIALSPNGAVVVAAIGPIARTWWPDGYIWSGRHSIDLNGHMAQVTAIKFSPDATLLATGDYSGKILLWKVKTQ